MTIILPVAGVLAAGVGMPVEDARARVHDQEIYRPEMKPVGWSADGKRVRFVHSELYGGYDHADFACGGSGVYETDGDAPARPIVTGEPWCREANAWLLEFSLSRDGGTVFILPRNGFDACSAIVGMDLERRTWRKAARICGSTLSRPAVSPDGRRIAGGVACGITSARQTLPPGCSEGDGDRLMVMDTDGSRPRVVGERGDQHPVWSPDGRSLAVMHAGDWVIAIINLETGARRVVVRGEQPAWSPDGQWLAFTHFPQDDAERVSLRIIRADGMGERTVFVQDSEDMRSGPQYPSPGGWPRQPLWSPDGRRIVFTKHFQTGNTLWIINADGTGLRRLSDRIPPAD